MVKQAYSQTFVAGQTSPHLAGRYDSPLFKFGAATIENMIVRPQGSLMRRPGTKIAYAGDQSSRLVPFQPTETTPFQLLFEPDGNIRVLNKTSLETTVSWAGTATGGLKMQEFDYVQVRNSLIIAHRDFAPQRLTRSSGGSWSIAALAVADGPWEELNLSAKKKIRLVGGTLTAGVITGTATIQARNKDNSPGTWFDDSWVGRTIRIRQISGSEVFWGVATIDSVAVSTFEFNVTIDSNHPFIGNFASLTAAGDSKNWRLGAWYPGNYPSKVGVFQNRLWFARDQWVWGSMSGDFLTYSPNVPPIDQTEWTTTADSAISFQSIDPQSTQPQWIAGNKVLHFATDGNHQVIQGSSSQGTITPTDVSMLVQSEIGAAAIKPQIYGYLYYVGLTRQDIYRADYQFQKNAYVPEKINLYDDEILLPRIRKIALATQPFVMLWCVLDTGRVVVYTINEIDNIYAAAVQKFYYRGNEVKIQDICVTQASDGRDQISLLTDDGTVLLLGKFRTNMGESYTTLTYANSPYSGSTYHLYNDLADDEFLTDFCTVYSAATPIDLNSINSAERVVDHGNYKQYLYSATSSTVSPTGVYEKGSPFFARVKTNKIVNEQSNQVDLNKKKRPAGILLDLWRTLNFKVTTSGSQYTEECSFGDLSSAFSDPPDPFTGVKEIKLPLGDRDEVLEVDITQDECVPLNINSLTVEYDVDGAR